MRELFARSEATARHAANAAIADVQRIEARYSRYKSDSFLSKINRLACMEIDFGGVVNKYAVDRAAAQSYGQGIKHGVVNLGGDIKVIGPRAERTPWREGIRHPRSKNALLDTLLLYEGALASSGDYERCILVNGVRYGHVLNPKTGWPVRRSVWSAIFVSSLVALRLLPCSRKIKAPPGWKA